MLSSQHSDPEIKELEGTTVTSFTLAVDTSKGRDESGKAQEEPMWVRVNAWGNLAETASETVGTAPHNGG